MPASRILTVPSTRSGQARNPLYLICDGETCEKHGIAPYDFVRAALAGGCQTIQYRHKNISPGAYQKNLQPMLRLLPGSGAALIVNDHAGIAGEFALPLHLGQHDILPPDLRVPYGRSTHSLAELKIALSAQPSPDYVALGTMFASGTKPEVATNRHLIDAYRDTTDLPLVLIGGITLDNVRQLPSSVRIYYAIIGDAFRFGNKPEDITKYAESWRSWR